MSGNCRRELEETTTSPNSRCDMKHVSTWAKTGVERGGSLKPTHLFLGARPDLPALEGALSMSSWDPIPHPSLHPSGRQLHRMTVFITTHPLDLERNVLKNQEQERGRKATVRMASRP